MWVKSIYRKAAFKRLKLYICRAGIATATSECQWPCGLWWEMVRGTGWGLSSSERVWGTVVLGLSATPGFGIPWLYAGGQ
jgi:hypothetical protein